jgi:hypothetical protein
VTCLKKIFRHAEYCGASSSIIAVKSSSSTATRSVTANSLTATATSMLSPNYAQKNLSPIMGFVAEIFAAIIILFSNKIG